MIFGGGIIIVSVQSVSPAGSGNSSNGLSIDGTSGDNVLGNNVGQVGSPAQLLNNREIMTDNPLGSFPFSVAFNSVSFLCQTILDGRLLQMLAAAGGQPTFELRTNNGVSNEIFQIIGTGGGDTQFFCGVVTPLLYGNVQSSQGFVQFGPPLQTFNTAALQVSGTMTHRAFVDGHTGAYNVDRDLDSGKILFNSGAATYTLPNMTGANTRTGFTIRAAVMNAAGITFQLSAGQTLRFGGIASSVAGTISATTVGSTVRLVLINSTTWVTESFTGTWVVT